MGGCHSRESGNLEGYVRSPADGLPFHEWRPHISRIERRRGQDEALWVKRICGLRQCDEGELARPVGWKRRIAETALIAAEERR